VTAPTDKETSRAADSIQLTNRMTGTKIQGRLDESGRGPENNLIQNIQFLKMIERG